MPATELEIAYITARWETHVSRPNSYLPPFIHKEISDMLQRSEHQIPLGYPLGYIMESITTHCTRCKADSHTSRLLGVFRAGANGKMTRALGASETIYDCEMHVQKITQHTPACDGCFHTVIREKIPRLDAKRVMSAARHAPSTDEWLANINIDKEGNTIVRTAKPKAAQTTPKFTSILDLDVK